jgi:NAD(P)-dependent dehydrogenase (short-subunit alcohol dehydrogenase family)
VGWWVLASGRDSEAGIDLEKDLEARAGGRFYPVELTDPTAPADLVAQAWGEHGSLDLLVNNAGVHHVASVQDTTADVYDRVMDTNLRAAVLLTAAAIPTMRAGGGGTIINVSSEAGILGFPNQVAYNISKAGLIMLTRSIVADHTDHGIRAVTVCPGTTRTPLVQQIIDEADDSLAMEHQLATIRPAGRLGRSEEIAAVVAFAASDRAPFMTGAEIAVDGGNVAVT